jgi:threonine dehydrogenase-like Zn-dependent dehydrogenase
METMFGRCLRPAGILRGPPIPKPAPGPGEVLLRVITAGVCGTDLHLHDGGSARAIR